MAAVCLATVLILTPELLSRILGLAAEASAYATFQRVQSGDFSEWQAANPDLSPSSGWKAIGAGIAGFILFVLIAFLVAFFLSFLPIRSR